MRGAGSFSGSLRFCWTQRYVSVGQLLRFCWTSQDPSADRAEEKLSTTDDSPAEVLLDSWFERAEVLLDSR